MWFAFGARSDVVFVFIRQLHEFTCRVEGGCAIGQQAGGIFGTPTFEAFQQPHGLFQLKASTVVTCMRLVFMINLCLRMPRGAFIWESVRCQDVVCLPDCKNIPNKQRLLIVNGAAIFMLCKIPYDVNWFN